MAASTIVEPGPDDATPRFVQSYCIIADRLGDAVLLNVYTDFLNQDGVPIPKYRSASHGGDIILCRFIIHSLFYLNAARLSGLLMVHAAQFPEFAPALLPEGDLGPKWANFHPSRVLRARPAVRNLPTPSDNRSGVLSFESFQKIVNVRAFERSLETLAFEREVRPRQMPQFDNNSTMGAFTHRMHGGSGIRRNR